MRRLLRFAAVLSSTLLCGACLGEVTSVLSADLSTEAYTPIDPSRWFSCTDGEGCLFRGQGHFDGSTGTTDHVCMTNLAGVVSFADTAGVGIQPALQGQSSSFPWRTDPDPKATLHVGDSFDYVTTARVPRYYVDRASLYSSSVSTADLHAC